MGYASGGHSSAGIERIKARRIDNIPAIDRSRNVVFLDEGKRKNITIPDIDYFIVVPWNNPNDPDSTLGLTDDAYARNWIRGIASRLETALDTPSRISDFIRGTFQTEIKKGRHRFDYNGLTIYDRPDPRLV